MNISDIIAIILALSAGFSIFNYHYLKLPTTIGVMVIALVLSIVLLVLKGMGLVDTSLAIKIAQNINFNEALMHGMLSALLFAGALHINVNDLKQRLVTILTLATAGVIISIFLVAVMTYYLLQILNLELHFLYCLIFGALISPTDPIAVLAILKKAGAPKTLEIKVTGESLFNDGVGYVLFVLLLGMLSQLQETGNIHIDPKHIALFFIEEAIGGVLYGFVIGYICYKILERIDDYHVEILVTIALVIGGYELAELIHVSGPLAIVIAGLMIGNHGREKAMTEQTRKYLDIFWELIDEILNSILFVLIGLEMLVLPLGSDLILASIAAIILVLFARFIAVSLPITFLKKRRNFSPYVIRIMTWGGLRGGLSVAMALSLPKGDARDILLTMTYACVVFSILIQGTTIGKLIRKSQQPNLKQQINKK